VDLALLKTASTLADKVMNAESTPKRRETDEEDDEDLFVLQKSSPAPQNNACTYESFCQAADRAVAARYTI